MVAIRLASALPYPCGVGSEYRINRVSAMIRAFVDDSGSDPRDRIFLFGCWVSKEEEWNRFSDGWQQALAAKPAIEYFRHHDAKSLSGPFKGWLRSKAEAKMCVLAEVIRSHENYGVISGIRNEVVSALLKRSVLSPKQVRSVLHVSRPYDWCFSGIVATVLQFQVNVKDEDKVDFIFDEGDTAFDDCSRLYRRMREELPAAMKAIAGIVTTGDDKVAFPLQAADLLAGQATTNIRLGHAEEPFKIMNRGGNRILFCPIRWGDPIVTGFADLLSYLNVLWSTMMIERGKDKPKGKK
jgi:hypothetical protein